MAVEADAGECAFDDLVVRGDCGVTVVRGAERDALSADAGQTRRGHEFHYSSADVDADARFAFEVVRGDGIHDGRDGLVEHRTLGTYCHLNPESGALDTFLDRVAAAAE